MYKPLDIFQKKLEQQPLLIFLAFTVIVSLSVSVFFFSPRFILWDLNQIGTFETDRANSFLHQIENPWAADVESALRWRLLIPVFCHFFNIRGWFALSLSWLGVIVLLAQTAWIILRTTNNRWFSFTGCILVSTTSAVVVSTGWLGMNDAWYLSGLMTVAFAQNPLLLIVAILSGSWLDEKFLLALPLALVTRWHQTFQEKSQQSLLKLMLFTGIALVPYISIRMFTTLIQGDAVSSTFLKTTFGGFFTWLPWFPMGWWMAFRLGWILLIIAFILLFRTGGIRYFLAVFCLFWTSAILITILAADMSRSAAMVLPLMVWGWIAVPKDIIWGQTQMRNLIVLGNLLIPALHITYTKASLISPLPLEIFRLIRP
ncbi:MULTISPECIES: hypothetical protein [unclassified Tolypothrix]|uniref:hypothetical protein n=1 Tax=unclassified Tolypothrix TaxID=2649714 RepID=UPI0005EAC706|nr:MULTISPECIES: hypothetical protein [unclassified Tolypothrix]BAY92057.1 hypothetical protein NIES3275_40880 [Microchaete diplosiphon NIES-3275]EKF04746.1 hypothetical protein FDUTEX481_00904 [Tolypothrix sp. PCC 7601]MBE9081738.1 hypothetical protein [Tolypothrix sp. LEGE 11397]UYD26043.1 hypothetical protein HGR01_32850 [Tolypothrix sp. PCC 7712]UYD31717.1 hypothetical protein HG267_21675 [Tolypothrix sp. PCC 7601]